MLSPVGEREGSDLCLHDSRWTRGNLLWCRCCQDWHGTWGRLAWSDVVSGTAVAMMISTSGCPNTVMIWKAQCDVDIARREHRRLFRPALANLNAPLLRVARTFGGVPRRPGFRFGSVHPKRACPHLALFRLSFVFVCVRCHRQVVCWRFVLPCLQSFYIFCLT